MAIKSVKEIAMERAKECSEIVGKEFLPALRIIYGVSERHTPTPIGSCFFLKVDDRHILVTAAHVVDHNKYTTLLIGDTSGLIPINGDFESTIPLDGNRDNDPYDFSFWALPDRIVGKLTSPLFIERDQISHNRGRLDGRQFLVMGYPISQNKTLDVKEKKVKAAAWTYQGIHVENSKLAAALRVSGNEHFFIKYERRAGTYDGKVENAISPRGVSGGVLLDLGMPDPSNLAPETRCIGLLAGLGLEYRPNFKAMVFLRIEIVLEQIRRHLRP